MRKILFLSGLVLFVYIHSFATDTIPADNEFIEYTGRIDFSNPLAPSFSYSGVSVRACFTGTSIAFIMDDESGQNYFNVILNGEVIDTLTTTTGKKLYPVIDGLKDTIHEIELFRRTELSFDKTRFYGFVVDEGDTLTTISNERNLFIEYIGNSITCGYGNEGNNGETFGATTENHYLTYAAITSRNFNARHMAVSKSGIGIYRNYGEPTSGSSDCMTNNYTRIFLFEENPKYDFAVQPDIVCINLGTNDFSTPGGDSSLYVSNYFRLIDTIQSRYSMPDIVCLLGPMMSGSTLTDVRSYLRFIADSANNKGKGNVTFFEMSAQTGDLGIGVDYHPTVAQHQRNATELTAYLKSLKGWKIYPMVMNIKTHSARQIQIEFSTPVHDPLNNYTGFSISDTQTNYSIQEVSPDVDNPNSLNIILNESMSPGQEIYLSYIPGTIQTEDSVKVNKIENKLVSNTLTETNIVNAYTTSDGETVMLMFNKDISVNTPLEGLILFNNTGEISIDSFSVTDRYLMIYPETPVIKDDSLFVSYSGNSITGVDEIALTEFSDYMVLNISVITSLKEVQSTQIHIFPNPSSTGVFYYSLDDTGKNLSTLTIEVLNSNGVLIHKSYSDSCEGSVSVQNPEDGVYILRFNINNQYSVVPVVISHK